MGEQEGDGRPRPTSSGGVSPARPPVGRRSSRTKYGVLALALIVFAGAAVIVASGSNPSRVAGSGVDVHHLPAGPASLFRSRTQITRASTDHLLLPSGSVMSTDNRLPTAVTCCATTNRPPALTSSASVSTRRPAASS